MVINALDPFARPIAGRPRTPPPQPTDDQLPMHRVIKRYLQRRWNSSIPDHPRQNSATPAESKNLLPLKSLPVSRKAVAKSELPADIAASEAMERDYSRRFRKSVPAELDGSRPRVELPVDPAGNSGLNRGQLRRSQIQRGLEEDEALDPMLRTARQAQSAVPKASGMVRKASQAPRVYDRAAEEAARKNVLTAQTGVVQQGETAGRDEDGTSVCSSQSATSILMEAQKLHRGRKLLDKVSTGTKAQPPAADDWRDRSRARVALRPQRQEIAVTQTELLLDAQDHNRSKGSKYARQSTPGNGSSWTPASGLEAEQLRQERLELGRMLWNKHLPKQAVLPWNG